MRHDVFLGVVPNQAETIKNRAFWQQALQAAIGPRRILLILDDVWTVEDARALQIGGPQCSYLLTARQSQIAFTFDRLGAITIPELEEADRLVLLARYVPRLVERDPQGAQALVQATGGLPLAVTLMGKYLASSILTTHPWPLRAALIQLQDTQEHLDLNMLTTVGYRWVSLTH
ncbi:MAG TPA: NB-ARC domain-containing protein [Ktedonobacteraceae bacterium]